MSHRLKSRVRSLQKATGFSYAKVLELSKVLEPAPSVFETPEQPRVLLDRNVGRDLWIVTVESRSGDGDWVVVHRSGSVFGEDSARDAANLKSYLETLSLDD